MRASRVILVILIIVILVAIGAYFLLGGFGGDDAGTAEENVPAETAAEDEGGQEPGLPPPSATPEVLEYTRVVVAKTRIPVGTVLTGELLELAQRPSDNVAVVAGVTFDDPTLLIGQFARNDIAPGQEILRPMLALTAVELGAIGSDLSLYVNQGSVAVAFPIDRFSGLAYSMRPGDRIDIIMSLSMVQIDPEFRTQLPNLTQRVDQAALLEGQAFLFPSATQGRLELVPAINLVGEIAPGSNKIQQPRQVTQLTIQQAQVLWVGTWEPQVEETPEPEPVDSAGQEEGAPVPQPTPQMVEPPPDVVILSLPAQDAMALKWAQETGIDITLALRAQGDISVFTTSSVSLPERVEQGGMTIPESGDFDLEPRYDEAPIPFLPPSPPLP